MPWEIRWTEWSDDHIARHRVSPGEVEQVVYTRPRLTVKGQGGTRLVFGTTDSGRFLVVVLAPDIDGTTAFVVTAREMTRKEKAEFRRKVR